MRRSLLLLILAVSAVAPSARASHCNAITFYTGANVAGVRAVSWDPASFVGCGAEHTSTDYIIPGSSYGSVFVSSAEEPASGTLTLGTDATPLTWTRGQNASGAPANFWYSQMVDFPVEQSILPGFVALPEVCFDVDSCIERPYRSVTTP